MTRNATTALSLTIALSFATLASAATFTWDNSNLTGNWATGSNWGGTAPQINTVTADTINVDGESGINVTTNVGGNNFFFTRLNVSAGDVVEGSGLIRLNGGSERFFVNAGTIRATTGNLTVEHVTGDSVNTGTISASNNRTIALGIANLNNTGGTIQATSSGLLRFAGQSVVVTGGNVLIDSTSQFFSSDVQDKLTFNGVTFDNAGNLNWLQQATTGNRAKWIDFGTTAVVTNTGSISITQNADATASPLRAIDIRVSGNASFDNQGTLNVTTNAGVATGTHTSAFILNSPGAAALFSNTGTINVTHATGAPLANTAQFVSAGNLTNDGIINVVGAGASMELGSNMFIQNAGRLFLDGDAHINAALVSIVSGELAGTGTINGNVGIEDTLNMRIGTTNDLLTINGDLLLNSSTSPSSAPSTAPSRWFNSLARCSANSPT